MNEEHETIMTNEDLPFSPEELAQFNSNNDFIKENIVALDTHNLEEVIIDKKLFNKGVQSVSEMCGAISALASVGITPSMAMLYLSEKEGAQFGMNHSLTIAKLNSDTLIQTSKNENANLQKNTI